MFAIGVRFVSGRYYAASHADRTRPEWPPHPDRLFSALVAACYQACGGVGRAALEWLERQGPPSLVADRIPTSRAGGRTMQAMVRTNDVSARDKDGIRVLPDHRKPQPRWFPSISADAPVYFVWPDASPDSEMTTALAAISSHVAYIGSSKSPVATWVEDTPPTPTLVPAAGMTTAAEPVMLRVPTAGRLAELDALYAAGLRPQPGHQQPYSWVSPHAELDKAEPWPSAFGDMVILARTEGPAPSAEATLSVTHALRRALLAVGDDRIPGGSELDLPELLHGHGAPGTPHCAFVALPYVAAPYADGHLLGVAVVFPRECDPGQRLAALRAVGGLRYVQTAAGRIGLRPAAGLAPDDVPWGLRPERWCGPADGATTWTSVTPVLFDQFPKASRGGLLVASQALARNAGLPPPVEVIAHRTSPLAGVAPARSFRSRRSEDDAPRYVAHLTVRFDRPVKGPVLLGAGRFFGLGLCVPYDATDK